MWSSEHSNHSRIHQSSCDCLQETLKLRPVDIPTSKRVEEAMKEVGATVEGYYAALSAHQLAEKAGVEMPICECAYRVLYEGQSVREVVGALMSRNKKREADESWI